MKMKLFLYSVLICLGSMVCESAVFSARTRIELAKYKSVDKMRNQQLENDDCELRMFVTVDNPVVLRELESNGAHVCYSFGNMAAVTAPLSSMGSIARVDGVKSISLERHLDLCNVTALEMSCFPAMTYSYNGVNHNVYSGNGIVVGMIDVGIDFNHINFRDQDGQLRIVRVYMPCDSTGTHPVVGGEELPGSEYTTPGEIAALTTDDSTYYHGTHTTGTAAGSFMDNGLHGVATGAQIVACGMPDEELTDFNVANSIKYIFDYADKVGLPAVINMSIGSQDGAHDGTSPLCQLFKEASAPGRICVVSAGNDGHVPLNVRKKMGESDSLATFLTNWSSREPMIGYSSMWTRSQQRHTVDLVIWDIQADTLVHRLDVPRDAQLDSVYTVTSETDSVFARYFDGELNFACAVEDNGLFHSIVDVVYSSVDKSKYRIGLINKAPKGETLIGWGGGKVVYSNCGLDGWNNGSKSYTISDLATTDSVISVGAYCSTPSFVMMSGDTVTYSRCTPGDLAYFSAFGPDLLNKRRPDLVAPGYQVASSVSRYCEAFNDLANVFDMVTVDGVDYPYGLEGGTSMSTPVVAGAIALWLEICPTLTTAQLRELMEATCYRDSYVENGSPKKWGYGKLDIDAGIKYLLRRLGGDVNGDGAVTAADVTCIYNIILGSSSIHVQRANVNCDDGINAADVTRLYNLLLNGEK